jgi:hypothetical protein
VRDGGHVSAQEEAPKSAIISGLRERCQRFSVVASPVLRCSTWNACSEPLAKIGYPLFAIRYPLPAAG